MNRLLILLFLFSGKFISAQNLIANGDFEANSACNSALNWISPTLGTPDYMQACNSNTFFATPSNFAGSQAPHSGNAYYGMIIKNSGGTMAEWREYIRSQLISPLVIGETYALTMYVSLADESKCGSDAIGALFSTVPISRNDNLPFTQTPQVSNTAGNFITNKTSWTAFSYCFVADSGYAYISIGNFSDDANTAIVSAGSGAFDYPRSYIYIDDVSLIADAENCPPFVGINAIHAGTNVTVFPNPFTDQLNISTGIEETSELILHNLMGEEVLKTTVSGTASINVTFLEKGVYFYKVRNKNKTIKKGKLIRN
ncbi:MAG: hypothetical protein K0S33_3119 [Bacteroidetes bacterium]|jgi:hypothetical protein|nr:hypothetical protein [Bacteroidota bacterium]